MPNVSSKRNRKEKRHTVTNIKAYVKGFVASIGDKNTAQTKALKFEQSARNSTPPDISTANFWNNVAGHIGKFLFILLFLNGCNKDMHVLHPALKVDECISSLGNEDLFTGKKSTNILKVTVIGVKTYKFKVIRMDDHPILQGESIIYSDLPFTYFDSVYTKMPCPDGGK